MEQQEDFYIEQIQNITSTVGVTADALHSVEEALLALPSSCRLWCLRGDLIQMQEDESQYQLADAMTSYKRAAEIDPACAEAQESMGYFYDVFEDDFEKAERALRLAIQNGAGANSYIGLARVLSQVGRKEEALDLLSSCQHRDEEKVNEIRSEIEDGIWRQT